MMAEQSAPAGPSVFRYSRPYSSGGSGLLAPEAQQRKPQIDGWVELSERKAAGSPRLGVGKGSLSGRPSPNLAARLLRASLRNGAPLPSPRSPTPSLPELPLRRPSRSSGWGLQRGESAGKEGSPLSCS